MKGDHSTTSRVSRRFPCGSENATSPSASHTNSRSFAVGRPRSASIATDAATNSAGGAQRMRARSVTAETLRARFRVGRGGYDRGMAMPLIFGVIAVVIGLIATVVVPGAGLFIGLVLIVVGLVIAIGSFGAARRRAPT